jgi:D-alanine-D-alanine ligase
MRVLILHDPIPAEARPDELDTLTQVEEVRAALAASASQVVVLPFDADLAATSERLRRAAPEVVFNLVESVLGQGRLIHVASALLESLEIPFTGSGSGPMLLSASKLLGKRVLAGAGVPTPDWRTLVDARAGRGLSPGSRWLIKSVWEHGSLGLEADSVVSALEPDELAETLEERRSALGGEAFAEEYVHGREFNVGILAGPEGPECLPIPEIRFEGLTADAPRVVGYRAKWDVDSPESMGTPRSFELEAGDVLLHDRLRQAALSTWRAFDLRGWARVDFRVASDGEPQVIDVNANPCLSADGGFAASLERAGITLAGALERIIADGLERRPMTRSMLRPTARPTMRSARDVSHSADRR